MSQVPSVPRQICPHCGALARPRTSDCWLCGAEICSDWPTLGPDQIPPDLLRRVRSGQPNRAAPRPFQFGISTLLLIMTLFAVLCSIWKMAPGLGVVLTVITCIGLLGLTCRSIGAAHEGVPLTGPEKLVAFIRPIVIVSIVLAGIGVVAFVGLLIVCSNTTFH
jgi:hypothetical protein